MNRRKRISSISFALLVVFSAGAWLINLASVRDYVTGYASRNFSALADENDGEDDEGDSDEDNGDGETEDRRTQDDDDRKKSTVKKSTKPDKQQKTKAQQSTQKAAPAIPPASVVLPIVTLPATPTEPVAPQADADKDGLPDSQDPHPEVPEIYIVEDANANGIVDVYE